MNGASVGSAFKAAAIGGAFGAVGAVPGMGVVGAAGSAFGAWGAWSAVALLTAAGAYSTATAFQHGQYAAGSIGVPFVALGVYGLAQGPTGLWGGLQGPGNAPAGVQVAQADTGTVSDATPQAVSARRVGTNDVEITYSDGTVAVKSGGTVTWRNNSPGDLAAGSFSNEHGAIGSGANGRAVFPDAETGDTAFTDLLNTRTYQQRTHR